MASDPRDHNRIVSQIRSGVGRVSVVRRIGLLGGTFDPIHKGHLDAARAARQALALERVLLVPTKVSPHRATSPRVSGYHRFAMASLAAADDDGLAMCDIELRSSEPSYTSTTLKQLALAGYDPSELFFISGADAFAEIAKWYDYPAVLERSHFVAISRPGCPAPQLRSRLPALAERMRAPISGVDDGQVATETSIWLVDASTTNVSSTELRRRLAQEQPPGEHVPVAVAEYIERHDLYRLPHAD